MTAAVDRATALLGFKGYEVWRVDYPPPPWPGLYRVAGMPEMTEAQLVEFADAAEPTHLATDGVVVIAPLD